MTEQGRCGEHAALQALQYRIDDCMARDIPALAKHSRALHTRCARGLPIDRGLARLEAGIAQSVARVEARAAALPRPDYALVLPVVEQRADILERLRAHQVVVVCGETGSGKTTQLPKLCLELGRGSRGRIGHTQPRRLAARTLAARIAEELHSPLGERVGYKVRFQDRVGEDTCIKIMTDGILLAEIQSDPELREYDTLIIDEAHERSLNIDFLLGYLSRLLPRRPDLKLVITSATIDPQRFSRHFGDAPVVEVSGRTWPVEIRYRPLLGEDDDQRDRTREQALLDAVDELAREGRGDILVFMPGERAIGEAQELLRKHHPPHTEIVPLYARLSVAQQNQVFRAHAGRRIVLATNVAETSLTVPGIHYVIDTGLARISRYSYRTKVQRLPVEPVSQASANQRSGRCGRVAAGICIRLYSEDDYLARSEFTEAEIQRTNLAAVILQMATLGLGDVEAFPFIDPPDPRFVRDGYKLLHELGAVDERHRLTALGREISRLPLDPRLARMILAARDNHCLKEVLIIAAALEVVDPRERPLDRAQAADQKHAQFKDDKSDFMTWLHLWDAYADRARHLSQNKLRGWCRDHFLSFMRMREWIDVHRQLKAQVHAMGMQANAQDADYRAIHSVLLTGLLGNIACLDTAGSEYTGARNLKFALFPGSALARKRPKWVMAAELVETGRRYLRTVAAIEAQWVEPLAGALVKVSYSDPHWEKKRARVVAFERVSLYGLTLVERRKVDYSRIDPAVSRELFIQHALVQGEYDTRLAFAEHNRSMLAELDAIESKSRRRDLLVDEQALYEFFDARLPEDVYDHGSFMRWWKSVAKTQPELLQLDRESLMRHGAEAVTESRFPDSIEVHGVQLPVAYRFSPGSEDDGVCVQLPLAMLNQVEETDFEWLVPGLLQEKCAQLIKSLPKPLRRHFVPAPDFAQACVQQAQGAGQGSLLAFLENCLQRITGVDVARSDWRLERLSAHLSMCFDLVDDNGRHLGSGRDLQALKQRFAGQARRDFARVSDRRFERQGISDWDFGELPAYVELERAGVKARGYPALCVAGDGVDLCLFDQAEKAQSAHREGLLALYRRQLTSAVLRDVLRAAPDLQRQALWFGPLGDAATLKADLQHAVLQAAFMEGDAEVRSAEAFRRRLDAGRARLLELAVEIGGASHRALEACQRLRQALKGGVSPQFLAAANEIREQMDELVFPGFLSATPRPWLAHLARYLDAARLRFEQLPGNVARDREAAAIVRRYRERYRQAVAKGRSGEALDRFRWQVEELRVSLFAQSLGTSEKVSPQRLDRVWAQIQAG